MSKSNLDQTSGPSWYSKTGKDADIVLSTRVRLSRNLANFPFPSHFRDDDDERVQTLVLDAFSKADNPDSYQSLTLKNIDDDGIKILNERGILDTPLPTGIVMGASDDVFCMVNSQDHVRIASFVAGFDCQTAYNLCKKLDSELQKSMQFAASYEFGYLTSSVTDVGSGMKVSVRLHLPSLSYAGKIDEINASLQKKGFGISACFGSGTFFASSLGAYYQVSTTSAFTGSELDQSVSLAAAVASLIEAERKARAEYSKDLPTVIRDSITRSYAIAKFSKLISLRESVDIVSNIKWGLNLGLLNGIEDQELFALLYRIQDGHLKFLLKNSSFKFEKDVENDSQLKIKRLRSLILQEAFDSIGFTAI